MIKFDEKDSQIESIKRTITLTKETTEWLRKRLKVLNCDTLKTRNFVFNLHIKMQEDNKEEKIKQEIKNNWYQLVQLNRLDQEFGE